MRAESHYNRGRALETRRVHPGPGSGGRGVAPKLLLFVGDYDEKWMFRKFVRRRSINVRNAAGIHDRTGRSGVEMRALPYDSVARCPCAPGPEAGQRAGRPRPGPLRLSSVPARSCSRHPLARMAAHTAVF